MDSKIYRIDNVLDLAKWLGKTEGELPVGEEYINRDGNLTRISVDGSLFGVSAEATVFPDAERPVQSVYINTRDMLYEECRDKLTELYGAPEYEWEEPFVRVKGGAVRRAVYKSDGYKITLASASERDYIEIDLSVK